MGSAGVSPCSETQTAVGPMGKGVDDHQSEVESSWGIIGCDETDDGGCCSFVAISTTWALARVCNCIEVFIIWPLATGCNSMVS